MHTKIRNVIKYALPITIVVTGLCFIAAALAIYFSGGEIPYTRERVGVYLLYLLIPSLPCLAMVIFEIIEAVVFDKPRCEEIKGYHSKKELLCSFYCRFDFERANSGTKTDIGKERRYRRIWYIIAIALSVISAVLATVLVLVREYTVENLNSDVIGAILVSLPLAALALATWCVAIILCDASYSKELDLLKSATKNNPTLILRKNIENEPKSNRFAIILAARITVFAVAAVFIAIGIINGGMADVLSKAVKICTECIGLG